MTPNSGELWSFLRSVLSQGADIYLDHKDKGYESYSARLDCAARERADQLARDFAAHDQQQRDEIARLTTERDKYKKEALIKFDCQVCSGSLEDENNRLRDEIARLRALLELLRNEIRVQSSCWALERSNQIDAALKEGGCAPHEED